MNSIVHIAHTTIQFPQNIDTFLCRFPIWLKVPKMRQYFVVFLCNMEKLQSCNSCYKRFTEKVKLVTVPEKRIGCSPIILYTHTYISIYIHIKELQKELHQELRWGAASGATSELCCRCGSYTLPLSSCKNLDFKNSIFFLFNKKSYF